MISENNEEVITQRACDLARIAHRGQKDKGGNDYFVSHITSVARIVKRFHTPYGEAVAYLHDVLEDTDVTEADLRRDFPDEVVEAVVFLTRVSGESYEDFIIRVKDNALATVVKMADLCNNMDLTRISEPTEKDRKRVLKYAAAMAYLAK